MKALTAVKILLIVTSHTQLGNTQEPTGFWFEELAAPYAEFTQAGAQVDIASPLGGKASADPKSEKESSEANRAFLADANAKNSCPFPPTTSSPFRMTLTTNWPPFSTRSAMRCTPPCPSIWSVKMC